MVRINPSYRAQGQYKPSWYDRFTHWLEGLPGSILVYYLVGAALSVGIYVTVQASQGAYAESGFFAWHIFLALQPLIVLVWIHYLDKSALIALERFSPAVKSGQDVIDDARYRLTTLPAAPTLVATFVGVLFYVLLYGRTSAQQSPVLHLSTSLLSMITIAIYFVLMWGLLGIAIYHTFHQITVIRNLFSNHTDADPYNPEPLYAFSGVTGRTAVILLLISYGWILLLKQTGLMQSDPVTALSVNGSFAAFSLFIFAWPLWGAHQLLVEAKKDAMTANSELLRSAVEALHTMVRKKEVDPVDNWHKALDALEVERKRIEKLPTWPWRPEALQGLLAAVVIPIIIWVAQFLLERFLG